MTRKRALAFGLFGLLIAAAVAQAGWFYQNGRWYYTPDVGTESEYQGIPNPETQPSYVAWTMQTESWAVACRNRGANLASDVVSVERAVVLTGVTAIDDSMITDKTKGVAKVPGHIDTDNLASYVTCQNRNWYADPDTVLVYTFFGTSEAFLYNKKTKKYESQSRQDFYCTLSDFSYGPLNLPGAGTPYTCEPVS